MNTPRMILKSFALPKELNIEFKKVCRKQKIESESALLRLFVEKYVKKHAS